MNNEIIRAAITAAKKSYKYEDIFYSELGQQDEGVSDKIWESTQKINKIGVGTFLSNNKK